jgi:hypothetical protein
VTAPQTTAVRCWWSLQAPWYSWAWPQPSERTGRRVLRQSRWSKTSRERERE